MGGRLSEAKKGTRQFEGRAQGFVDRVLEQGVKNTFTRIMYR